MNLREYCELVYRSTCLSAHLPMGDATEIRAFVDDLENDFRREYANKGCPYGESEEALVEYLLGNVQFEIENIRKEGRTHG